MMVLGFCAGSRSFGISIEYVSEVIPLLNVERVETDISGFLGVVDFRGLRVPLFDLRLAQEGVGAKRALSTRIIIIEYKGSLIGLLAEHVLELFEVEEGAALEGRDLVVPQDIIPKKLWDDFSV